MPAGFNKGQIEYIKTIANVNGHKTYKHTCVGNSNTLTPQNTGTSTWDTNGKYAFWTVGQPPQVYNDGGSDLTSAFDTLRPWVQPIDVYNIPINVDPTAANSYEHRVTPECFLESVHMKMRLIQELDVDDTFKSHQEYRLCVFRHKEKQHSDKHLASNYSNPLYDMFLSARGHKVGPQGLRQMMSDQGNTDYFVVTTTLNDSQALLTAMPNREDYVWMKDCRFYLGKEYGGKHIFETQFHWDHRDPISTESADLSTTESDKNYLWYVFLICTTNSRGGPPDMPYVRFDSTTHVTSG